MKLARFVRNALHAVARRARQAVTTVTASLTALLAAPTFAALPTATAPSTAPASGDWLGLISGYAKDAGIVLGLIVGVAAFIWLAWATLAKFNEAREGKAEWGAVGLTAVIAAGIAVFDVYLLNTAASII